MSWDTKLEAIIDYVEHHLQRQEEAVDAEEVAGMAGCSYQFFLKVFSYLNEISFADYIRARKMTLAGYDIKSTDLRIVDISYKYGYDSPTSFTRAFQQFHGIPPKEARETGAKLCVYPRMQLTSRENYTWRIETKPAFTLIGKSIRLSGPKETDYQDIQTFWSDCQRNGTFSKLISVDEAREKGMFGVCSEYDGSGVPAAYSIMVCSGKEPDREAGFTGLPIPQADWAVFDCYGPGPSAIMKGWKYLLEEWVVKYPFRHAPCPELEWYSEGNAFAEDYHTQIWIPIIPDEEPER